MCIQEWKIYVKIRLNSPCVSQLHTTNFDVSFLLLKTTKISPSVPIPRQSTLKSQNSLSLNYDISPVCTPILLQKTSVERYFSEISGFTTSRQFASCMLHFCFSSGRTWAHSHHLFPAVITILIFAREMFSFSLYIAMSENNTWREELKANFQLNISENTSFLHYIFQQRAGVSIFISIGN